MGTWSKPGAPNVTDAPVSRFVATMYSRLRSSRKSLVRPDAAKVTFHALRAELMLLLRRARLLDIPLPDPRQTQNGPR